MNHRYISLGGACDVAMMMDILDIRQGAYPFDWLWNLNTGLKAVNEIIEARFEQILDEKSYRFGLQARLGRDAVFYKSFADIIHMHSDPMNKPEDHAALVRRVSRFNQMLRSKDELHFIYYANLNERQFFDPDMTVPRLADELLSEGKRFMSFMAKKGHGKRTTLLLVLQTNVEQEAEALEALAAVVSDDERIRIGYTISRMDNSQELHEHWCQQWLDLLTTKTDMPESMVAACRAQLGLTGTVHKSRREQRDDQALRSAAG